MGSRSAVLLIVQQHHGDLSTSTKKEHDAKFNGQSKGARGGGVSAAGERECAKWGG